MIDSLLDNLTLLLILFPVFMQYNTALLRKT